MKTKIFPKFIKIIKTLKRISKLQLPTNFFDFSEQINEMNGSKNIKKTCIT